MTFPQITAIFAQHHIPLQLDNYSLGTSWHVYSAIKKSGDPLSRAEHLIIFDELWATGIKEKKINITLSDALKEKIIDNRWLVHRIDMIAVASIEGRVVAELVQRLNLPSFEEAQLWKIFHVVYPRASMRDTDEINRILNHHALIIQKLAAKGKINVLDLGCGKNGNAIATLVNKFPQRINGYGVDLDIQEAPSYVNLVKANLTKLPFADQTFDLAYSAEVMYYFNEKQLLPIITEVLRVLKPTGILTFNDYRETNYKELLQKTPYQTTLSRTADSGRIIVRKL